MHQPYKRDDPRQCDRDRRSCVLSLRQPRKRDDWQRRDRNRPLCVLSGCYKLTSVTIGSGVTEIGEYAFIDCTCLETVNYRGTEAQWAQISMKDNSDELKNAAIVCNYTGE